MYFKTFTASLTVSVLSRGLQAAALLGSPASVIERSNNSSCGQVYITGFPASNCNSAEAVIAPIGSTDAKITPLLWDMPDIKSIRYGFGITNATGCYVSPPRYPTQYRFYNRDGQHVGAAWFTLGQTSRPCVDFYNASVVSYDGVQRLVPFPDDRTRVGQ